MKKCPQCNTVYTDESLNFCLSDGAALSVVPNDVNTASYAGEQTVRIDAPRTNPPGIPAGFTQPPQASKGRGCLIPAIIVGVIGLVLIVGAGVLGFMAYRNYEKDHEYFPSPTPSYTPSSSPTAKSPSPASTPSSTGNKDSFTKENAEKIKTGMTKSEVEDLIGPGHIITTTSGGGDTYVVMQWKDEKYNYVIINFKNDKVFSVTNGFTN